MLYFFRTPPGVKVGRAALDEDAIRLIEAHNPDIEFDWTRILKGQGEPAPERRQPPPPPPPRERRQPLPAGEEAPPLDRVERRQAPPPPPTRHAGEGALASDGNAADFQSVVLIESEGVAPAPNEIEGPVTAAQERLGSEGLSRLRGRYAEMLARISERITDPARQEELKLLAERLNPDAWVTTDDVAAGLDSYEATFETLRGVVGHRRRRRRRRPQQQEPE